MIRLKVREIARAKGISQRKLWARSEVDLRTIQRMFHEPMKVNVTLDTMDRLAKALNVDISLLMESVPPLPKTLDESLEQDRERAAREKEEEEALAEEFEDE